MTWNITDRFPSWGETGEFPSDGFFYDGDTNNTVNEKHLDALWNGINQFEEEVIAALNDIDSDGDGRVDAADTAELVKGNDVVDGNGVAFDAENVTETYKGSDLDTEFATVSDGGRVSTGDGGLLYEDEIADGDTFNVYKATLTAETTAAPSGTNLVLVTLDGNGGGTLQSTIINGDGTLQVGETGTPLASYENTTGSTQQIGVIVDNGEFTSGSGSNQSLFGSIVAREQ
jgi:hypothetical protein